MVMIMFSWLSTLSILAQEPYMISYHPNLGGSLVMGQGVDIYNLPASKNTPFIDVSSENVVDDRIRFTKSEVFISAVSSEQQLQSLLGIEAAMNLSFWGSSASANFSNIRSLMYNKTSLLICLTANVDYGTKSLMKNRLTLSREADSLRSDPRLNPEFLKRYGHAYVSAVRQKQIVNILISISGVTEQTKAKMTSKFGLKTSFLLLSGEAKYEINQILSQKSSKRSVSISSYYLGKDHKFTEDSQILKGLGSGDSLNLDAIKNVLDSYLGNLNPKNIVETDYFLASFSNFGLSDDAKYDMSSPKFFQTVELFNQLHQLNNIARQISEFSNENQNFVTFSSKNDRNVTRSSLSRLKTTIRQFQDAIQRYVNCNSCILENAYRLSDQIKDEMTLMSMQDEYSELLFELNKKYSFSPLSKIRVSYDVDLDGPIFIPPYQMAPYFGAVIPVYTEDKYRVLDDYYGQINIEPQGMTIALEIVRPTFLLGTRIPANENPLSFYTIIVTIVGVEEPARRGDLGVPITAQFPFSYANTNRKLDQVYSKNQIPGMQHKFYANLSWEFAFTDNVTFNVKIDVPKKIKRIEKISVVVNLNKPQPPYPQLPINTPAFLLKHLELFFQ